jgi:hypothetical protein
MESIYYTRSTYSIPLAKRNVDNIRRNSPHHVSTTTEFSPDDVVFTCAPEECGTWEIMYTVPKYLQPSSTPKTSEKPVHIPSTSTPAARLVPIYNRIVPYSNNIIRTLTTTVSPLAAKAPIIKSSRVPHSVTNLRKFSL